MTSVDARVVRELVDHRPDGGEIGVAGVRRRRPDRDVEELRAVDRLLHVERERDPVAAAREDVVEPGLVDRHLARPQPLDALGHDVAHDDVVAEIREARAGDEADVAGPEDCDPRHGPRVIRRSAVQGPEALGDRDHRRVRELVEDRVRDPVRRARRAERDPLDRAAGRVDLVLPAAVDERERRVLEDRRGVPGPLLDLPVLVRLPGRRT